MMTTIPVYIFGALACLAAQGAIFFIVLTIAVVSASAGIQKAKSKQTNVTDFPCDRQN